jgi:RimJ/RimL family protein N-acetyltransferase
MGSWRGIDLDELELRTERLTLRPWRLADAGELRRFMADTRLSEFLPLPRPYTHADAVEFVTGPAAAGRREGSRLESAVVAGERLVGAASLRLPVGGAGAEIGYWIACHEWGRGFATEAVHGLAGFAFDNGVRRVRIEADVANTASAAVALRAGFAFEGIARQSHQSQHGPADHALFARLVTDPGTAIRPPLPLPGELSDGVVGLRAVRPEDWPTVLAEADNAEALAGGFGIVLSRDEAIARSARSGLNWLIGRAVELLMVDAATGAGAGTLTLRPSGPPGVWSIGYGVLPAFRGRGFTWRALQLVSGWAFGATGIQRLELGCKVTNLASARSAERGGFVREGIQAGRLANPDGDFSDQIGFARLRPLPG